MTKLNLVLGGYTEIGKTTFLKNITNNFVDDKIAVNIVKWNNCIFYDLSGDLKYRNFISKYLNIANVIIMCYRGDFPVSFFSISSWLQDIKKKSKTKIVLLDLHKERTVIRDEASFYCINNGYFHYDLDYISEKDFIRNIVEIFCDEEQNKGLLNCCCWF